MSKTNELRRLVNSMLCDEAFVKRNGIKRTHFEVAGDEEMYPHLVFSFERINLGDLYRKDILLIIDIFDKAESAVLVENIADEVEDMFNAKNLPQEKILPTFFLENRRAVSDEDKKIRHRQIEILVQNY